MTRRWLPAAALALAVVAVGVLARVDVEPPGGQGADPAEPDWERIGVWRPLANSPGGPRRGHTAVWTGPCAGATPRHGCGTLLLWGGHMVVGPRSDGAAYTPATDTWTRIPPAPREPLDWGRVPGVWTGAGPAGADPAATAGGGELVLWGPANADFTSAPPGPATPRGVAYDPVAGTWRTLPEAPIEPRFGHTLTWTGEEAIVWGGQRAGGQGRGRPLTDGAAYDPGTDTWRMLPDAPLAARQSHVAVWLPGARQLVVWGGAGREGASLTPLVDGAAYDPDGDAWDPLPELLVAAEGSSAGRGPAAARLDDPERLAVVAAISDPGTQAPVTAVYEPGRQRWRLLPAGAVGARRGAQVGGGDRLVVWGGGAGGHVPAGAVHDPRAGRGRAAPGGRAPAPGESATWTGRVLLTWGGGREGALWDPRARPAAQQRHAMPHEPGQRRSAALPAGHETGWRLQAPPGAAPTVEVQGSGAGVELWLEARSPGGARIRRIPPAASDCGEERCVHRFEALPGLLPGPVDLRLRNTAAGAVVLTVTPVGGPRWE